jgi:hypothetical protein
MRPSPAEKYRDECPELGGESAYPVPLLERLSHKEEAAAMQPGSSVVAEFVLLARLTVSGRSRWT